MDIEDLDQLLEEVEKKGFRARFLDPNAPDPIEYCYLPALGKDGVAENELPALLDKVRKVAHVKKWVDVVGVDAALEPVTGNSVAYTAPNAPQVAHEGLSVEEILRTARTNIPLDELPKTPFTPIEEDDPFDDLCVKVAKAYGVPLSRLRREALSEDISGVENLQQALVEVAQGIKAQL